MLLHGVAMGSADCQMALSSTLAVLRASLDVLVASDVPVSELAMQDFGLRVLALVQLLQMHSRQCQPLQARVLLCPPLESLVEACAPARLSSLYWPLCLLAVLRLLVPPLTQHLLVAQTLWLLVQNVLQILVWLQGLHAQPLHVADGAPHLQAAGHLQALIRWRLHTTRVSGYLQLWHLTVTMCVRQM